ncbi:MAG: M14 family metallopeptidase [Marivibrio sp.]|uniref:succinylglutamate desuccinylase/aspartoacylase family protein n=1 Tax=Marivibrio sp. TaxID=2039719 RepID=UPI0032EF2B42
MPRQTERLPLASPTPGVARHLMVHRYGAPGGRPKVYIQASLHADEWPGLMAIHHLLPLLDAADAAGEIQGEIIVVPYANPLGMDARYGGGIVGRYAYDGSGNYNRDWADLAPLIAQRLNGPLSGEAEADVERVRGAIRAAVADLPSRTPMMELRRTLMGLSADADHVLDLHCDGEAELHLYANEARRETAMGLAEDLGIEVALLEEEAGGGAFDTAPVELWWRLKEHDVPGAERLPVACFGATVELRGKGDVSDELGARDAAGLLRFLARVGATTPAAADRAGPAPAATPVGYRLDAVDTLNAPVAGLACYLKPLGATVQAGEVVAVVIDPAAEPGAARTEVTTQQTGRLFAFNEHRLVQPGDRIAKVAGREPLSYRKLGALLED